MDNSTQVVVVGSKNPVKGGAALSAFQRMFPEADLALELVSVPSGVSPQPIGDEETIEGAVARARGAEKERPGADYWVGIEGGIDETEGGMIAFAWVVVIGCGGSGRSRTGCFFLPDQVAELVRQGMELGEADDIVLGRENAKQQEGAIGLLTDRAMDRKELYEHAVVLALVSLKNPELYSRVLESIEV